MNSNLNETTQKIPDSEWTLQSVVGLYACKFK